MIASDAATGVLLGLACVAPLRYGRADSQSLRLSDGDVLGPLRVALVTMIR